LAAGHPGARSLVAMAFDSPALPLVIGHRGACGYRPEHTLASYALAIELGADFVEPDLVSTRDGVLVARHENEIGGTTDVARRPEFAARRTTKVVGGVARTGWFTEDFTLAELKTLRAVERIPQVRQGNTLYDGRFQIPTLQEVVELAQRASDRTGRTIGIYPETKLPTYFAERGLALEEPLVDVLHRNGYRSAEDPAFVQSFEVGNLRELSRRTGVRLVQLVAGSGQPFDLRAAGDPRTYDDLVSPAGLAEVATYASGIGPAKDRVVPRTCDGALLDPTSLVADAHRAGLLVHPYTFRNENAFLPAGLRLGSRPADHGHASAEYRAFWAAGVDGLFSDNPDTARLTRDEQLLGAARAA
jgi:glycerophosphoryl diester phosphodiesterase